MSTYRVFFGNRAAVAAAKPLVRYSFDLPTPNGYPIQLRTWFGALPPTVAVDYTFRDPLYIYKWPQDYNVTLRSWFGKVPPTVVTVYPFKQNDWPNSRGYVYPIDVRTIAESFNRNLIGKDSLPPGEIRTDLSRGYEHPIQLRSWTWNYNLNLIGKDRLPIGAEITALPPQPPLSAIQLRTWINTTALALITTPPVKPFNQQDWPLNFGHRQPIQIFTASYNQNLINKDQLPTGEIVTDLPPRQPQQPTPIFTASYNKNLVAQDQLPVGERSLDLPAQQRLAAQTWINAVNLALTTTVTALPFSQTAWPLNAGPRQPDRSYGYAFPRVLIGQDRLPFRQQDWPLYRPFLQPAYGYTAWYNRNLVGKDRLPIRQQYWPVPPEFRRLSDWIVRTNPNLFVPPIPPPEILPRDPTHLRARGGFETDAHGPSSVERRGSDKFYRGRNES